MRGRDRNPPRKATKASQVFHALRHDIINGIYQPGDKLPMEELKERYGVGYSPLREGLSRLVSNGLVLLEEQCGFSVAPMSVHELHDLYQVRGHIENLALELAMEHGDDEWEADKAIAASLPVE